MKNYLKKELRKRENNLKYDFLPSIQEIIEKPANRTGLIIMYVIIALIVCTICWACFARLDIVVTAAGTVHTEKEIITLKVVTAGRIKEIYVNDGEYVTQGDIILTLDSDVSETVLQEYEYNLEILNIQKEVYEKIYNRYKNDDYTIIELNTEEYGANKRFADAIILENNIVLENLEALNENETSLVKSKQLLTVMQNLNSVEADMESVTTDLKSVRKNMENYRLEAPVSGIYHVQNEFFSGKNVFTDDIAGYIMPEKNSYIFTAYVSNKKIYDVGIGDIVKVKITAFDNTEYEYIDGEIISVSDVPVSIENQGNAYQVDIRLYDVPEGIKTGMEGSIDIIIGTRTVMDYFMEPFKKGLMNSLTEN